MPLAGCKKEDKLKECDLDGVWEDVRKYITDGTGTDVISPNVNFAESVAAFNSVVNSDEVLTVTNVGSFDFKEGSQLAGIYTTYKIIDCDNILGDSQNLEFEIHVLSRSNDLLHMEIENFYYILKRK